MDTSIIPETVKEIKDPPKKWRCSADGKHWAYFPKKKCRYCLPVYE